MRAGDRDAEQRLYELVYPELRQIARRRLAWERYAPESTESMVHECYLKLTQSLPEVVGGREHFFALVSRMMRQILVDHARARMAQRRDKRREVALEKAMGEVTRGPMLVRLDEALEALAQVAPRPARLVEMRFFGGLTAEETAVVLELDVNLVRRELRYGQSWLKREMAEAD